jgi:hypothetical protein
LSGLEQDAADRSRHALGEAYEESRHGSQVLVIHDEGVHRSCQWAMVVVRWAFVVHYDAEELECKFATRAPEANRPIGHSSELPRWGARSQRPH